MKKKLLFVMESIGIGNYSRRFEPLPAAQGFALRILENL